MGSRDEGVKASVDPRFFIARLSCVRRWPPFLPVLTFQESLFLKILLSAAKAPESSFLSIWMEGRELGSGYSPEAPGAMSCP